MRAVNALARALLAIVFVRGGADVLRKPEPRAEQAGPAIDLIRRALPFVPGDRLALVRATGAVHLAGGAALATGRAPRLAAAVLAASLVPTTLGGHAFWTIQDPVRRAQQRTHFGKNLAILGGLLLAATQPRERRR